MHIHHIRLIASHWTRHALRGGAGLTFLLLALLFGLGAANSVIAPVELAASQMQKKGVQEDNQAAVEKIIEIGRPVVRWALGGKLLEEDADSDSPLPPGVPAKIPHQGRAGKNQPSNDSYDRWADYLLNERPAILSIIFLVLIFGMPFLIPVIGFNQVSGDVQSRGLRYLLPRTERSSIYTGRFLGTVAFTAVVMLFVTAAIVFYVAVKMRIYMIGPLVMWGLHGFVVLTVLSVPYIAVCSCISALVDSPFLSLVTAKLVILGIPLAAFLGGMLREQVQYVNYLLPWGIQNYLFHPSVMYLSGALLACLGYAAIFFLLGYYHFKRRDL